MFADSLHDTFSPYLDPEPWAEFYDDFARRNTTAVVITFLVHALFFVLIQPSFIMPDLKEEEPETIDVQIVAFEKPVPQPEPEPEPPVITPATPAPAPPPRIRPKPKPTPPPPPPAPVPAVEPEPDPVETPPPPPPPDILAQDSAEPEAEALPEETVLPEPEIVPEPVTEPEPEPEIVPEILPEVVPDIMPETALTPEPLLDPISVPDATTEPELELLPEIEVEPEIIPEIEAEPDPVIEPEDTAEPFQTPNPVDTPPTSGALLEPSEVEPLDTETPTNIPEPEVLDPEPLEPNTEPSPETDIIEPEDAAPVISTAPTILASPDAPLTPEESQNAIPQSQAADINDLLFNPRPSSPGNGQPNTAFGNPGGLFGPSGATDATTPGQTGTRRANPGAGGWNLTPPKGRSPGEGYTGLVLDIRCREAGRTHADCPEYLRQYQGRNASGWEGLGAHQNSGSTLGPGTRSGVAGLGRGGNPHGGGDIYKDGIGNNSINNGGPSTTVLDDTTFSHGFQGIGAQDNTTRRMRDVFKEPEEPWNDAPVLTLPEAEPTPRPGDETLDDPN